MRLTPELLDDANPLTVKPAMHDTSLFSDVPRSIWVAFLSAWALLFGLFIVFFSADGPTRLVVLTAAFFGLMTLGLPAALAGQSTGAWCKSPRLIMTRTGALPVGAAATQILLIPIAAVLGLIAFIIVAL